MNIKEQLPVAPSVKPSNPALIYVGKGETKYVPEINDNYVFEHWSISRYDGTCDYYDYYIEFGTPQWNRWAEKVFDLPEIPEGEVWIGPQPIDWLVETFGGKYCGEPFSDDTWSGGNFNELWSGVYETGHYTITKTDPNYDKAFEYFTGNKLEDPVSTSESILSEADIKLMTEYRTACNELEEAKKNGWKIDRKNGLKNNSNHFMMRDVRAGDIIIMKDYTVRLNGTYIWSEIKIIKTDPKPSFEIIGDGGGPYKPEYHTNYWKFGCKEISHGLIKSLVETIRDNPDITKLNIGKGEFTASQLQELHEYHTNK